MNSQAAFKRLTKTKRHSFSRYLGINIWRSYLMRKAQYQSGGSNIMQMILGTENSFTLKSRLTQRLSKEERLS
jgi:hypothetical protein